jgi:hypothetical protein
MTETMVITANKRYLDCGYIPSVSIEYRCAAPTCGQGAGDEVGFSAGVGY